VQSGTVWTALAADNRTVNGGQKIMPLLQVVLPLIVVGVLLWLVNSFLPMAQSIKTILNAVVVIVVVVWLLNVFGLLHSIQNFRI
jgi:ABC-type spermidine/putrescine transport system permease subunit II